jgi:hypothetical protein
LIPLSTNATPKIKRSNGKSDNPKRNVKIAIILDANLRQVKILNQGEKREIVTKPVKTWKR